MNTSLLTTEFSLHEEIQTDRRSVSAWLVSHIFHYWPIVLIMFLGAVGNAGFAALIPVLTGMAFNAVLETPPNTSALIQLAILLALSQIVRGVVQFSRNFGAELLGQRLERDTRNELYVSLLGKSMAFHSLQPVGDTMARATNDVREINLMLNPGINLVIGSAVFLFMPLILAPRYHLSLMLTPAIFIIAYYLAIWQYLHELSPVTTKVRQAFGRLNTRLAEAIDGVETVKGMAQEEYEVAQFGESAKNYRNAFVRQGDIEARFIPLLLIGFANAAGLLHAIYLYRVGLIDVGDVVAYFGLIQLFRFPSFVSLFAYSQVSTGIAGARRILELINRRNELDQNLEGYTGPMKGEIEFQNVNFEYKRGEKILEDVSFKVGPGMTVAIVGQTGSGKTTLVKLVNRTYDTTKGEVLIDGVDVRDWSLESLRKSISIIEQDIFLFSRKISENITFSSPGSSKDNYQEVAVEAQAHDFITHLENGYETVVGERGVTLSGGERQRIAIARALLTDPQILVLDDSTSAIDSATEDKIQQAIFRAAKGRTTLIITHRLSQIRWADLILVIRNGKLIASGTHEGLMQSSTAYRNLFRE
ncbi:MAG: ABC transporter ATP-binding protein [Anaerolineales bacterium]